MMTREEHLGWCKKRALEYVQLGDLPQAFASMYADLLLHEETRGMVLPLWMKLYLGGNLSSLEEMRKWINGFN